MKILIIGLCLLLIGGYFLYSLDNSTEEVNYMEETYQGPIPIGYDLEHFRKTGETIKELVK